MGTAATVGGGTGDGKGVSVTGITVATGSDVKVSVGTGTGVSTTGSARTVSAGNGSTEAGPAGSSKLPRRPRIQQPRTPSPIRPASRTNRFLFFFKCRSFRWLGFQRAMVRNFRAGLVIFGRSNVLRVNKQY